MLCTHPGLAHTAIQGKQPSNESFTKQQHQVRVQQYGSCCSDTKGKTKFKEV